jgi:hypothetical protein
MASSAASKTLPISRDSIFKGRVIAVAPIDALATFEAKDGRRFEARCGRSIDLSWLEAALEIAPVEAVLALIEGEPLLWDLYPGPEHASVRADLVVKARRVYIDADEGLEIGCRRARVQMNEQGRLDLRAEEILARSLAEMRVRCGRFSVN